MERPLTNRQRQVAMLISEGYSDKDIAEILKIALGTVERHRANLYERLEVHCVAELVRWAIRNKLIAA